MTVTRFALRCEPTTIRRLKRSKAARNELCKTTACSRKGGKISFKIAATFLCSEKKQFGTIISKPFWRTLNPIHNSPSCVPSSSSSTAMVLTLTILQSTLLDMQQLAVYIRRTLWRARLPAEVRMASTRIRSCKTREHQMVG